jgi:hypothetical protein
MHDKAVSADIHRKREKEQRKIYELIFPANAPDEEKQGKNGELEDRKENDDIDELQYHGWILQIGS